MGYGRDKVKDIRMRFDTSPLTAFVTPTDASWAVDGSSVFKPALRELTYNLTQEGMRKDFTRSYLRDGQAPVVGPAGGSISFKMLTGNGSADTTAPFQCDLLSYLLGASSDPASKTDAAEAGGDTDSVNATAHGQSVNTGVLLGARGDGRGNGEVRLISVSNTDDFDVLIPISDALSASDALVFSHNAYLDTSSNVPAKYISFLIVFESGRTLQLIDCMGGFTVESIGAGEMPQFGFDFRIGAWEWSGTEETFDASYTYSGNNAVSNRIHGGLFLADYSSPTRVAYKAANVTITPNLNYEPIPDENGVYGYSGYVRTGYDPIIEMDAILGQSNEDLAGLIADFKAGTAKTLVFQCGAEAQNCFAVAFKTAQLDSMPVPVEVNGIEGAKLRFKAGDTDFAAPYFMWF